MNGTLADLRLAGPVAVTWAVTAVLIGSPSAAWPVVGAACGAVAVGTVLLAHGRLPDGARVTGALVLVAGLGVGLVGTAVAVGDTTRNPGAIRGVGAAATTVVVTVDRDLAPADRSVIGTLRAIGDTEGLAVPTRVVPPRDDGPRAATVAAGSRITATASVQPDVPGSATSWVVFLRDDSQVVPPTGVLAGTDRVRKAFARATSGLPEPGAGLLRGLAMGDRSGLDPGVEAAMETSALTHLTAVSGSNCAVVVALVVLLGRAVGLPRAPRSAIAVVLLLAFVVLVRPDPSIVRATVMAVVVLVVHLSGRPVRGVPLVAVAALGMLVVDPWVARSFAFALSVLATTGIVVLAPPLTALLERRLWAPVAVAVAVPIAAQIACWPVTIPLAAALPTYAVPANLLAEPLAPVVTVLGLVACLLGPVWPSGAQGVAAVAWAPASAIGGIAHAAAAMPAASVPWPDGVVGVSTAAVVCGCLAVAVLVARAGRVRLLVAAAVVGAVGIGWVAVPRIVARSTLPRDWTVAACDVGQGDATLVRSRGSTALVDTGDDVDRLTSCLDLLGVAAVDLLVLTHFDRDHVGAVGAVAAASRVALVGPTGRAGDERVVDELVAAGVGVHRADDTVSGTLGALGWRVLWPRAGDRTSGNDASIVVRFDPGATCAHCVSSVLLGDLDAAAQRRLRTSSALVPADVVKVSHHGSADQDPQLYREIGAGVGLIGVGADNTYGHPTESALRMLADAGTEAFRTDTDGTVVVAAPRDRADPGLEVWTAGGASAAARRLGPAPPEGTHARQEARARRREDRPGLVVRHPPSARRARHGA